MTRAEHIIGHVRGPDVLDIGCAGQDPPILHDKLLADFPVVWGIDFDPELLEKMQSRGYENVRVGDAQDFDMGRPFDTVVAGEVIEHLESPASFLRCATAHLKPGGRIIVTTPNVFGLANVLYAVLKFPRTCSNPQHVLWLCPATMTELATRCGLDVEHWELIVDHSPTTRDFLYRAYWSTVKLLGGVVPKRLRCNAMLFVLRPRAEAVTQQAA